MRILKLIALSLASQVNRVEISSGIVLNAVGASQLMIGVPSQEQLASNISLMVASLSSSQVVPIKVASQSSSLSQIPSLSASANVPIQLQLLSKTSLMVQSSPSLQAVPASKLLQSSTVSQIPSLS